MTTATLENEILNAVGDVNAMEAKPRRRRRKKAAVKQVQSVDTPLEKIAAFHQMCDSNLVDREEETRLLTIGLVSGLSVFFVGKPGTGKSMMCDALCQLVGSNKVFRCLMRKQTDPSELFGPMSIEEFRNERFRRVVDGYLPTAEIAFLDEIWKSSSAVLNNLLQILNEGTYTNGDITLEVPLKLAVAASNEYPPMGSAQQLSAMYDRFLIRKEVNEITSARKLQQLLFSDISLEVPDEGQLSTEELDDLRAACAALPWAKEAEKAYKDAIMECFKKNLQPSSRRLRAATKACSAHALLHGKSEVTSSNLTVLQHILWDEPDQRVACADIFGDLCDPAEKLEKEIRKALDHNKKEIEKPGVDPTIIELSKFTQTCYDLAKQAKEAGLLDLAKECQEEGLEANDSAIRKMNGQD